MGQSNNVLDRGPGPPRGRGKFRGGGIPIVKYRERIACAVCRETADQMQERYALWSRVGPRNDVLGWAPDSPPGKGKFGGVCPPMVK